MTLDYIYHSGFAIEAEGVTVIIDYYKDSSETEHNRGIVHDYLLQRPGKLYVLATHFHPDHFNREILTWKEAHPDIRYIFSKDILKSHRAKPEDATYIKKGETYEDETIRIEAFGSTDVGISFLMKAEGKLLFHAGDLNWWHWNGEPDAFNADIEKSYTTEINRLKGEKIDVAFVPADLRLQDKYFWAVNYFLKTVGAKRLFPMHFWGRFDVCTMLRQLGYGETIAEITQENEKFEI